ncbi:MAG: tetratricopeptide repeat protein [Fimbriimonadaceae bacterium]|nr:tetratricopeptide repeat protein [Fimbriimonadaceae bacterium]
MAFDDCIDWEVPHATSLRVVLESCLGELFSDPPWNVVAVPAIAIVQTELDSDGSPSANSIALVKALSRSAHFGQVLLDPEATHAFREQPSRMYRVESLGEHIISFDHPILEVFAVVPAKSRSIYPPIQSLGAIRHNFPASPMPFVGRMDQCSELIASARDNPLTTLIGPPGVGKSSLARSVAMQWLDEAQSAYLVRIREGSTPESLRADLVNSVDPEASPSIALERLLGPGRTLILLDGCDQAPRASVELIRELARCNNAAVLVTARSPLCLEHEVVHEVGPLSLPEDSSERSALESEAVRAFLMTYEGFESSSDDLPIHDVARIVQMVDGNPAMIVASAIQVAAYGIDAVEKNLLFKSGSKSQASSFSRALEQTWGTLSESAATLLSRLSVLCPTWRASAAVAIGGLSATETLDLVRQLSDARLVEMIWETSDHLRFLMPPAVIAFAASKLSPADRLDCEARHFDHFLSYAEAAYSPEEPELEIKRLQLEYPNIRLALMRAIQARSTVAARFLSPLSRFWHRKRSPLEALTLCMGACNLMNRDDPWAAPALNVLGTHESASGYVERAKESHEKSFELAMGRSDPLTAGLAQSNLVGVHKQLGNLEGSIEAGELSVELLTEANDPVRLANALNNHSAVLHEIGRLAEAQDCAKRALALARKLKNPWLEAYCLGNLGEVAFDSGDSRNALHLFSEELRVGLSVKDMRSVALAVEGLARVEKSFGDQARVNWLSRFAEAIRDSHELHLSPSARRRLVQADSDDGAQFGVESLESQFDQLCQWYF